MTDLTVPDGFEEWPFDACRFVLASANTSADLRREIDEIIGMPSDVESTESPLQFSKDEAAALVMALGGPQEVDDDE